MKFITKSGSEYQVDLANKRVRRLSPTVRDWQSYNDFDPIQTGKHAIFYWDDSRPGYDGLRMITTRVVYIEKDPSEKTNA